MRTTASDTAHHSGLPSLPNWETAPEDLQTATRTIKAALRARIAASGRRVDEMVEVLEGRLREQVAEIVAARARHETIWPVIEYSDIEAGAVSKTQLNDLHRRGCLVVRGHFDHEQALAWDRGIVEYVDTNRFFENYRGPGDAFFESVGSEPEIYPVYWSPSQMEARQSPRMANVQRFLNARWKCESEGRRWFDPERDTLYADRIRRRPAGANSGGLGAHLDPGTLDLWMTEAYQRAFHHVFDGTVEQYDPWDASHRTAGPQYPGSTMCSAFRTFQGWTALSDMNADQGVLHTVPIPEAFAYLLLRPLLSDVPDDDMCGVLPGRAFPVNDTWHSFLLPALTAIPDVAAGDSVWWHCDLIHSVAPVANQEGWGNVMYIPAAPSCVRNDNYLKVTREAFVTGSSPTDFPGEHYEREWPNRFQPSQLNPKARHTLGLV